MLDGYSRTAAINNKIGRIPWWYSHLEFTDEEGAFDWLLRWVRLLMTSAKASFVDSYFTL